MQSATSSSVTSRSPRFDRLVEIVGLDRAQQDTSGGCRAASSPPTSPMLTNCRADRRCTRASSSYSSLGGQPREDRARRAVLAEPAAAPSRTGRDLSLAFGDRRSRSRSVVAEEAAYRRPAVPPSTVPLITRNVVGLSGLPPVSVHQRGCLGGRGSTGASAHRLAGRRDHACGSDRLPVSTQVADQPRARLSACRNHTTFWSALQRCDLVDVGSDQAGGVRTRRSGGSRLPFSLGRTPRGGQRTPARSGQVSPVRR